MRWGLCISNRDRPPSGNNPDRGGQPHPTSKELLSGGSIVTSASQLTVIMKRPIRIKGRSWEGSQAGECAEVISRVRSFSASLHLSLKNSPSKQWNRKTENVCLIPQAVFRVVYSLDDVLVSPLLSTSTLLPADLSFSVVETRLGWRSCSWHMKVYCTILKGHRVPHLHLRNSRKLRFLLIPITPCFWNFWPKLSEFNSCHAQYFQICKIYRHPLS